MIERIGLFEIGREALIERRARAKKNYETLKAIYDELQKHFFKAMEKAPEVREGEGQEEDIAVLIAYEEEMDKRYGVSANYEPYLKAQLEFIEVGLEETLSRPDLSLENKETLKQLLVLARKKDPFFWVRKDKIADLMARERLG